VGDREAILGSLPEGQGGTLSRSQQAVKTVATADLWPAFVRMLEFHRGEIGDGDSLAFFRDKSYIDPNVPEGLTSVLGQSFDDPWQAEAGVTFGGIPVAETGSILLATGPQSPRLTSLSPPVHIAVLDPNRTVASLEQALSLLEPRTSVLITGPSRTADVEGVIVMGVHGPKRLIVVPWTEEIPA
jgi:L-lactate dehydrogenase complex protein LldG